MNNVILINYFYVFYCLKKIEKKYIIYMFMFILKNIFERYYL